MARQSVREEERPALLRISISEAQEKLDKQLEKLVEIARSPIHSEETLDTARSALRKWSDYTRELLRRIFTTEAVAIQFRGASSFVMGDQIGNWKGDLRAYTTSLESIRDRLELMELAPDAIDSPATDNGSGVDTKRVFVVYGQDERAKNAVYGFLKKLELEPIVLHDQPNSGKTLIEKFEHHADVGYAVVILTGDDEGRLAGSEEAPKARARQNVILELGYFFARLGRDKVCALYEPGVELPSDIHGMAYVELDTREGWHKHLARELKSAGIQFDLAKLLV